MADITTQTRPVSPSALQTPASEQAKKTEATSLTGHDAKIDESPQSRMQDSNWKTRLKNLFSVSARNREVKISSKKIEKKPLESRSAKVGKSGEPRFARLKQAYNAFKTLMKKLPKFFRSSYSRATTARKKIAGYTDFYNEKIKTLDAGKEGNSLKQKIFQDCLNRANEILSNYPQEPTEETDKISSEHKRELMDNVNVIHAFVIDDYVTSHGSIF